MNRSTNGSSASSRFLLELGTTFIAMSGWRLGRLNRVWIVGGASSLLLAHWLTRRADPNWLAAYWIGTLIFYYAGNSALLARRRFPVWLVGRVGEERALRIYDTLLGLMFLNQGLGVSCMGAVEVRSFGAGYDLAATLAGLVLVAIGVTVKVWATRLVGVDIYYYHDLFLGRPLGKYVESGPYRYFANPMYGVGQCHAYGYALLTSSLSGLAAAMVSHVLIYAFYFTVERPFVRRHFSAVQTRVTEVPASTRI